MEFFLKIFARVCPVISTPKNEINLGVFAMILVEWVLKILKNGGAKFLHNTFTFFFFDFL